LNLPSRPVSPPRRARAAFARADLLALVAGLALLFLLQAPLLAGGREAGRLARCVDNLRRLMGAWHDYADERGHLVGASIWPAPGNLAMEGWAGTSWLDLTVPTRPDNWDHDQFTRRTPLYPHLQDVSVFTCPADPSRALAPGPDGTTVSVPRTRSYAMNSWTGGPGWSESPGWRVMLRLEDFVKPGPAGTMVLLDEREDSINSGYFVINMNGYPNQPGGAADGGRHVLVDVPGDGHDGGAAVAFADGHARVQRWRDPRTTPPRHGGLLQLNRPMPHNPDVFWLQDHATRRP
jgi:prepilin-type processing-associated H-X9-DG protein